MLVSRKGDVDIVRILVAALGIDVNLLNQVFVESYCCLHSQIKLLIQYQRCFFIMVYLYLEWKYGAYECHASQLCRDCENSARLSDHRRECGRTGK